MAQLPLRRRTAVRIALLALAVIAAPLLVNAAVSGRDGDAPWFQQRRDASDLAPDPALIQEPVIQVYAARAVSWRGVFSVHTWIAIKPGGAPRFTRYEVIGFGVANGRPAVNVDRTGPDNYWFGAKPYLVLDRRGPGVDALIERVQQAIATYPHPHTYWAWPGPNSNTFTAHVARTVPELRLEMPANAVGKDFLPGGTWFAAAPSGTGYQASLYGVLGVMAALDEGIEVNLLGLSLGIDFSPPAVKLPGLGRIGLPEAAG
jgi:hypothetical protein